MATERSGFRPRGRKTGVPAWVWLVLGGLGLLMLSGCACGIGALVLFRGGWIADVMQSPHNARVTKENYEKIHDGMTAMQVKAILGEPNATQEAYDDAEESGNNPRREGGSLMRWKKGADYIEVTLSPDGKVTDTAYQYDDGKR